MTWDTHPGRPCADPAHGTQAERGHIWFPDRPGGHHQAVALCHTCPVEADCLTDALDRRDFHGIWGGTTERQRRRLARTHQHPCVRCGTRFQPANLNQIYCGPGCSHAAHAVQQADSYRRLAGA